MKYSDINQEATKIATHILTINGYPKDIYFEDYVEEFTSYVCAALEIGFETISENVNVIQNAFVNFKESDRHLDLQQQLKVEILLQEISEEMDIVNDRVRDTGTDHETNARELKKIRKLLRNINSY